MKEIKCVSENYNNVESYSKYKLKLLFKNLYIIPLILVSLMLLVALNIGKWNFFLYFALGILGICSFILALRYFVLDPLFFDTSFYFDESSITIKNGANQKVMKVEKISSVSLYKNYLLIEWLDWGCPWLIRLKIEDIDDSGRDTRILELIKVLKLKCSIKDHSEEKLKVY